MSNSVNPVKEESIVRTVQMHCFSPDEMDVGLDGLELYNRQFGRGNFFGELFRASLDSAALDVGYYNDVPTGAQGSVRDRIIFGLELEPTDTVHLNGERLRKNNIGVILENKEITTRFGNQPSNWLVFQAHRKDLRRCGCTLPSDPFSLIRTTPHFMAHLVGELRGLLSVFKNAQQISSNVLDVKMVKDHLSCLFALALDSDEQPQKLCNRKYQQLATRLTDYMAAHLDERITMMRLCELSGKSERTLRRVFQRIYSISPRSYLTIHRLNAVYRKLRKSSPYHTTIYSVALEYGFLHVSRFSGEYKKLFGEYPSETLARV